jgi:hypothetical protein
VFFQPQKNECNFFLVIQNGFLGRKKMYTQLCKQFVATRSPSGRLKNSCHDENADNLDALLIVLLDEVNAEIGTHHHSGLTIR